MKMSYMKKSRTVLYLMIVMTVFPACMTSKKALQRGDYYKAVMMAVEHLRTSPNNKKSQEALLQAYPLAKSNSHRIINKALESNQTNKYAVILDEYFALDNMSEAIYHSPKALELIPNPEQYGSEISRLLPMAAEEAYEEGVRLLNLNTFQSARDAYYSFLRVNDYVEGYRDVLDKIQQALYEATFKVVVQKPVIPLKYQLSADFFYDNLMAQIGRVTQNKFVRFYTYEEAKNEKLDYPNQYLILNFEDFSIGNMRESRDAYEVSRDSVLVGTTTIERVSHNVYGTVKASMITYRREVMSEGVLSAQFINASNNRVQEHKNFPGQFVWFNEWATFRGDERALSSEQYRMTVTEPVMPPPHQDLFIEFTKPIFDQVVSFVNAYYRKLK